MNIFSVKKGEETMHPVNCSDLGRITFHEAWDIQKEHFQSILEIKRAANYEAKSSNDILLICEHEPVYTLGKSGSTSNIIANSGLNEQNVVKIDRGGDITFHGPGQIVCYPILDLEKHNIGLKSYVQSIEQVIIDTLKNYHISAGRLQGANGVWIDADDSKNARKICAIGVKCSRFVTMHGLAFNVNTDLRYFDKIVPCGIANKSVTSLQKELGMKQDIAEVKQALKSNFSRIFNCAFTEQ